MLTESLRVSERDLVFSTGKLAKQASGSCVIQYGETVVLVTVVIAPEPKEGTDFLPLVCDYIEKTYAAGKIPGGFIKREGKPSEKEILTSRLIDRPIRPLFPKGFFNEIQIIATVLSIDPENDPDILSMIGASFALELSGAPFQGPIGAVRVGMVDGDFKINPTRTQLEQSKLDLVVAGTKDAIVMVEGKANFIKEEEFIKALEVAHIEIKRIASFQEELVKKLGIKKEEFTLPEIAHKIEDYVVQKYSDLIKEKIIGTTKLERRKGLFELTSKIKEDVYATFSNYNDNSLDIWINFAIEKAEKTVVRRYIFETGRRIDGRLPDEIRPITCEVGLLPRTHGSAVFTRGETQALVVTTLGTSEDEQKIDALIGETFKSFMLHYNFFPFCTGEVKPLRAPGRREIGHGNLAERALQPVIPDNSVFPYTIRVVSDILESNGSSSMASVCGGSLSLMDAGVPIREHVAGIAMGLMIENGKTIVLSDILGDEDHIGDMDFKVCGTKDGITAVQMDIKIAGVSSEILKEALEQARRGRLYILDIMYKTIEKPRPSLSVYAPRVFTIKINKDRIKDLIGPGGKNIRNIIEQTNVNIDINDDGTVNVYSNNAELADKAIQMIKELTFQPEVGGIYLGKVTRIEPYGAFVQLAQGVDGLLHISQLSHERVRNVTDVVKIGDEILVKVIDIDQQGKIKLSRKEALGDQSSTKRLS